MRDKHIPAHASLKVRPEVTHFLRNVGASMLLEIVLLFTAFCVTESGQYGSPDHAATGQCFSGA